MRPLKFKTPEEIQSAIDKYIADCEAKGKPKTVTGLCLALDTCRQTLLNYEERPEFVDTIKKAKLIVENYYEERLLEAACTGAIFSLKNNFGWKDKQEHELTHKNYFDDSAT